MEPAGTCLSVCEGILVVQGLANSKPLAEGWVRLGANAGGETQRGETEQSPSYWGLS